LLREVKVKIAGGARNKYFTTPLRSSAIFGPSAALPATFGRRQMTNEALTRGAPAPKHPRQCEKQNLRFVHEHKENGDFSRKVGTFFLWRRCSVG
jgi:hypothetical protein